MNILYANSMIKLINRCLIGIGEIPLEDDTLIEDIQPSTDAYIAKTMIEEILLEGLLEGWYFNVDVKLKLVPDASGFIGLPQTVLRLDGGRYNKPNDIIIKSNKLYSKIRKSFYFENPVFVDIINYTEIEDLPLEFYNWIGAYSAYRFQSKVITDPNLTQVLGLELQEARFKLEVIDNQYRDTNLIDNERTFR